MSLSYEVGSYETGSPRREPPTLRDILCRPLPERRVGDRWLLRGLTLLGRHQVNVGGGLEHIAPANDPFILVLNHSTRRESLLVPALLTLLRGGRLIHFMADWNFRLIPGIGLIYRRGETITVTRKPARPRVLNLLKPLYRDPETVLERARARLLAGLPVGIFPEARVNRDPYRLLRGRTGAACLSLETGVPIVPAGIRLSQESSENPGWRLPLEVEIGAPLHPPALRGTRAGVAELRAWHAAIMGEISRLSGKAWDFKSVEFTGGEQRCMIDPAQALAA